jgi:pimeloyl-ACP methyl ester carboxylesterase
MSEKPPRMHGAPVGVTRQRIEIAGPSGRKLEVELAGPDDGQALIYHTGTPSAGTLFVALIEAGAARGVRHIAYSRPGYAGSDRDAGRRVADCAQDVGAIADQLGVEQFLTVGSSGGGPHALACAALLGQRVRAAATIAGVAPRLAEGLDWAAGMGAENLDEFHAAEAGEEQLLAYLERERAELARASGAELHAALGDLLSEPDRRELTGAYAEHLAESMRAALARGPWGWFDDDMAHMREWGFDLGAITRPVTIWQGEQDRFVPFSHGQWLAEHVPAAAAQLRPRHGHLSLAIDSYGEVLDDLIARAG